MRLFDPSELGLHLPGAGLELSVTPAPRWPIEHRNLRALHGMVTGLFGLRHHPHIARFALIPWPSALQWGVYFYADELPQRLALTEQSAELFGQPVTVRCGPLWRVRTPSLETTAQRWIMRLRTITPVCIRSHRESGKEVVRLTPAAEHVCMALTAAFPERLGCRPLTLRPESLAVVSHDTIPVEVPIGGKYGMIRGWEGEVVLDVDAQAKWLLECAALVGLGGRTSLGFGRIQLATLGAPS